MIKGKELYPLRKHCLTLGDCCHKNINRILDEMVDNKDCAEELCKFAKCCIVLEKLCECICTCCCNGECVSSGMMSDYKMRCRMITNCCKKLMKKLSKEKCKYLRCDQITKMCADKKTRRASPRRGTQKR